MSDDDVLTGTPCVEDILLDLPGGQLALRLHVDDAALAEPLRVRWEQLLAPDTAASETVEILEIPRQLGATVGAAGPDQELRLRQATYTVSGLVTRRLLARLVGDEILLHSGAVDHDRLGRVLLIGPSGAGKSTAVTRLAQDGKYLSDELAILAPSDGAITGYPKPVSRANREPGKQDIPLDDLGLDPALQAGPPQLVVLLARRRDEPGPAHAIRIPLLDALPRIAAESSSLWLLDDPLGSLAHVLDRVGGALEVTYSEAADLEAALAAAPDPVHETWETLDPIPALRESRPGEQTVSEYAQAIAGADGLVILQKNRTVRLTGITALAWELLRAEGPMDAGTLESALVREIGADPRAAEVTTDALARLGEMDVITRRA